MAKSIKASIVIGGAITGGLKSALRDTKTGLTEIGRAVENVTRKQALMGRAIDTFARQGRSVDGLRAKYAQLESAGARLRREQQRLERVQTAIDRNMDRRNRLRGQLFDAVALGATVAAPIKMAVDFESAMADVRKVVDFDTPQQFREMTRDVVGLSRVLPMAAADIAAIVAAGGQSGIARDQLMGFASSAIKVGVAFSMTAEEAGQMSAELRAAFRMSQGEIDTLFDKVNLLANTTAASEARIASVLRRVGPLGEVAGVASGEIAALGATLIGIGVQEEVAATGLQNFMLALVAGESATKRQRNALKALGLDATRVANGMQSDAQGTILSVLGAARALPRERQASILQDLFGRESLKAIAPMLTVYDQLVDNLNKVNDAKRYAGAVEAEYAARAATSANNLQLFRNRIAAVGVTIGNSLLPALNQVLAVVGPVVSKFGEWAEENPRVTTAIVGATAAAATLATAGIALGYAWTFAAGGFLRLKGLFAKFRAGKAVAEVGKLTGTAVRATGPIRMIGAAVAALGSGPVLAGVAALVGGALLVRKYWQPIGAFMRGTFAAIGVAVGPVLGGMRDAVAPLVPLWRQLVGGLSSAWRWLTDLIAPVQYTAAELEGAASAGQSFGRVVGAGLAMVGRGLVMVIGRAVAFTTWAVRAGQSIASAFRTGFNAARAIVGAAVDWIMRRVQPLSTIGGGIVGAMRGVAGLFGVTLPPPSSTGGGSAAPRGHAAPTMPKPMARGGGAVSNNSTTTINITQLPGESGEELARRIEDERRRREGVARRGQQLDAVS